MAVERVNLPLTSKVTPSSSTMALPITISRATHFQLSQSCSHICTNWCLSCSL